MDQGFRHAEQYTRFPDRKTETVMNPPKLALFPLLRQIHALDLPKTQLLVVYPWAVFVCAVSTVMGYKVSRKQSSGPAASVQH
jgi:hypothetical protein